MRPTLLIEADEAVRTAIGLRHRHVLVDEYQDVNRDSARLLLAVAGDGSRLWVVGDARQSIYRFRGASSIYMARFTSDYPGAVIDRLGINYRSSQEVIATFAAIAPHMAASQGMLPLALEADKGSYGIRPQLRRFDTLDDEAAGIAARIRELEASGVRLRPVLLLGRSAAILDIKRLAGGVGVPVAARAGLENDQGYSSLAGRHWVDKPPDGGRPGEV